MNDARKINQGSLAVHQGISLMIGIAVHFMFFFFLLPLMPEEDHVPDVSLAWIIASSVGCLMQGYFLEHLNPNGLRNILRVLPWLPGQYLLLLYFLFYFKFVIRFRAEHWLYCAAIILVSIVGAALGIGVRCLICKIRPRASVYS